VFRSGLLSKFSTGNQSLGRVVIKVAELLELQKGNDSQCPFTCLNELFADPRIADVTLHLPTGSLIVHVHQSTLDSAAANALADLSHADEQLTHPQALDTDVPDISALQPLGVTVDPYFSKAVVSLTKLMNIGDELAAVGLVNVQPY
jgi:hypothetical protein